jgi:hypothetical protein
MRRFLLLALPWTVCLGMVVLGFALWNDGGAWAGRGVIVSVGRSTRSGDVIAFEIAGMAVLAIATVPPLLGSWRWSRIERRHCLAGVRPRVQTAAADRAGVRAERPRAAGVASA